MSASDSESGSEDRHPSWQTIAIGGLVSAGLIGLGMAFFTLSSDRHGEALGIITTASAEVDACLGDMPPATCASFTFDKARVDSLNSQSATFEAIGVTSFVAGWLVAGATVAYAMWPRDEERGRERAPAPAVQATPVVGPGTAGLVLRGHF